MGTIHRWFSDKISVCPDTEAVVSPTDSDRKADGVTTAPLDHDLSTTARLFDALMREAPMGVAFLDTGLRYVMINQALADMNGIPMADHLGRTIPEVLPALALEVVPLLQGVLDTGEPVVAVEVSGEIPSQPGEPRHWHASYYRVDGPIGPIGLGLIADDVTDQRTADRRLRKLIDGLFTFVGLCAPDGTLLEANRTALDAAGVDAAEVIGRPFWETYWWSHSTGAQAELRRAVQRAGNGELCRYDAEVRLAGDRFITIDFQLVPLLEHGRITALVPSGVDITERQRAARQLGATAAIAQQLSAARTTDDVVRVLHDAGPSALDADFVNVAVRGNNQLVVAYQPGSLLSEVALRYVTLPAEAATPLTDAVRTGQLQRVSGPDDADGRYTVMWPDVVASGFTELVAAPLVPAGTSIGALGVAWAQPRTDRSGAEARLAIVAKLCAQTLSPTLRGDQHEELVKVLQRHLLPVVPPVAGLDVAVGYEPATEHLGFGGDWYDVVVLDEHRSVYVVGDIAGHGIEAAAEMAQVRATINALVRLGVGLDELLGLAHQPISVLGHAFVGTAVVAIVDTTADECTFVCAGHPPPVLRTPHDATRVLDGATAPPLGMRPSRPCTPGTVAFPPGSTLVLYSDGLVERRGEALDDGIARLVGALDIDPHGTADAILDALGNTLLPAGGARLDDVAAVVVKRRDDDRWPAGLRPGAPRGGTG